LLNPPVDTTFTSSGLGHALVSPSYVSTAAIPNAVYVAQSSKIGAVSNTSKVLGVAGAVYVIVGTVVSTKCYWNGYGFESTAP
jgi:hypothetical protein